MADLVQHPDGWVPVPSTAILKRRHDTRRYVAGFAEEADLETQRATLRLDHYKSAGSRVQEAMQLLLMARGDNPMNTWRARYPSHAAVVYEIRHTLDLLMAWAKLWEEDGGITNLERTRLGDIQSVIVAELDDTWGPTYGVELGLPPDVMPAAGMAFVPSAEEG